MSLILDHKNGNPRDCRLPNLRIVCPNCNATLDTHCRGSKKLERKKERESQKKENVRIMAIKQRKVTIRPTYEVLKKEISESNFCKVGKKYGVSDNAIRKWIKSYENN